MAPRLVLKLDAMMAPHWALWTALSRVYWLVVLMVANLAFHSDFD